LTLDDGFFFFVCLDFWSFVNEIMVEVEDGKVDEVLLGNFEVMLRILKISH